MFYKYSQHPGWVFGSQRYITGCTWKERDQMTPARIQSLVAWVSNGTGVTWEERLSELADYRNITGTATFLPNTASTQAGCWVTTKEHLQATLRKRSQMTPARIQSLVGLGFEWDAMAHTWEERLSELVDYHANQGCNVYS
jgi:hypothetical protein